MKTILKILGVLIVLVVAAAMLLPVLFKDDLVKMAKEEANKSLEAEVDFGEFDLSLISSFPNFMFEISDVSVKNTGDFEGTELAKIGKLELEVDLMSVIKGEKININTVGISDAYVHVIVEESGAANYDIAPIDTTAEVETEIEEPSEDVAFKAGLKSYFLKNINVIYDDREGDVYAEIKALHHEGTGDFTQDVFELMTKTSIEALTYKMEGVKYMNQAAIDIDFDTEIDMVNSKYTFKKNEFKVNDLVLNLDGWVAMPTDDIEMDLTFAAPSNSFRSVLSLVPGVFLEGFEDLKTSGSFALNGMAKGVYTDETLPAFDLALKVDEGKVQYPDVPKAIEDITVDLKINNPGGSEDATDINLKRFYMTMADDPIEASMHVSQPMSDPNIDGSLKMKLDLGKWKEVLPTEAGEEYAGVIDADVVMKGLLSYIENEEYEKFTCDGKLMISDMLYDDPAVGFPVKINASEMTFSPKSIGLVKFDALLGTSDIQAFGEIANYLPYYFHDSTIAGSLNIASLKMDINELYEYEEDTTESEEVAVAEDTTQAMGQAEAVPGNIDFVMNTNIKKLIYEEYILESIVGKVVVRDEKADMTNLNFDMLGGNITMNGYYETTNLDAPTVDFRLDAKKIDVKQSFETFNTVQKLAPIAEDAEGAISADFVMTSILDGNMEPIYETMNGGGSLQTHTVQLNGSDVFQKVGDLLKNDKVKNPTLSDVNIDFEFKNGRVYVDPFDVKIDQFEANIAGSNGFDATLDYLIKTEAPTSALGSGAGQAIGALIGTVNSALGSNVSAGDKIQMNFTVTGTTEDPKVRPSFPTMGGDENSTVKDKVSDELNKKKDELEKQAREEAERLKKEAEAKAKEEAERLKKEAEAKAKAEAERLKKEAEAKAKEEAEKQKKKVEEEAKKKLKGLIGK